MQKEGKILLIMKKSGIYVNNIMALRFRTSQSSIGAAIMQKKAGFIARL
ncbi:hypothetical protein GH811_02380 [Acetobacterium malicum]|uniref:Uncharacterized protein n=1 Tax=Acetobacterium malicum TaxID=52692 RepID=A0ABR6YTP2_9FIRM|nr:hypothetical protein [Acetobacterium malicum]MBC3898465.1 hypothetical protein [Acetobacterium malicum]